MILFVLYKKAYCVVVDWKVTLLESVNKRCQFLEHVAGETSLSNVEVIRERAEVFPFLISLRFTYLLPHLMQFLNFK